MSSDETRRRACEAVHPGMPHDRTALYLSCDRVASLLAEARREAGQEAAQIVQDTSAVMNSTGDPDRHGEDMRVKVRNRIRASFGLGKEEA